MPTRNAAIERMLTANSQWAEDVQKAEPSFFEESAKGQSPHVGHVLRLSSTGVLTAHPSDPLDRVRRLSSPRFYHHWLEAWRDFRAQEHCQVCRSFGFEYPQSELTPAPSQLKLDDYNALAVLRYAVDYLGVEHGALHSLIGWRLA